MEQTELEASQGRGIQVHGKAHNGQEFFPSENADIAQVNEVEGTLWPPMNFLQLGYHKREERDLVLH
jgi:hypothetical protein